MVVVQPLKRFNRCTGCTTLTYCCPGYSENTFVLHNSTCQFFDLPTYQTLFGRIIIFLRQLDSVKLAQKQFIDTSHCTALACLFVFSFPFITESSISLLSPHLPPSTFLALPHRHMFHENSHLHITPGPLLSHQASTLPACGAPLTTYISLSNPFFIPNSNHQLSVMPLV